MLSLGFSRKLIFRIVFFRKPGMLLQRIAHRTSCCTGRNYALILSPFIHCTGFIPDVLTGAIFMSGLAWIIFLSGQH
jgi:hypothetical protein